MSSTLGSVAAVRETESPSQLRPALIQSRWTVMSDGFGTVGAGMSPPVRGARLARASGRSDAEERTVPLCMDIGSRCPSLWQARNVCPGDGQHVYESSTWPMLIDTP